MTGLIPGFNPDGVITVNRVILRPEYTVEDLEERVAVLCENVKTYHSDTGFVGGFVALNSGQVSNEGSTIGQAVADPLAGQGSPDRHVLAILCRSRTLPPLRHLPAPVQTGTRTL